MSGKTEIKSKSSRSDRRSVRTRDKLGNALIELMQDQPFDSITVQQVLDRAQVSRSTFYSHYRDKDDLFLSDVEDFLELVGTFLTRRRAPATRLFPVEEFFSHIATRPSLSEAIRAAGKGPEVRELGTGCFARSIEKRLILARGKIPMAELHATSHFLSGALFSLLEWLLCSNRVMGPKDLDAYFHRMAGRGLRTVAWANAAVNQKVTDNN
jgi:AcrR family transcriptional regulator